MTASRHIYLLHTRRPSVSEGQPRTVAGARAALRTYEDANPDIPAPTRRMMGLSALGKRFGRKILEEAVGKTLPQLPFRDASWRWWNALALAGLGDQWPRFVAALPTGGVWAGADAVRRWCVRHHRRSAYMRFLRHAGTDPSHHQRPVTGVVWTKGGIWRVESPLTRLLVRKQHLPPRPLVTRWQQQLGHERIRLLERELMHLVDPDLLMSYDAKWLAVAYARRRLTEMLGWRKRKASIAVAVWFFQQQIPFKDGVVVPGRRPGYTERRHARKAHDVWSI